MMPIRRCPADGEGQLAPDARLFAPACHLTGGFALYCWFNKKHKGDFVLTLGGYHKSFQVPDHYPKVPRLGLHLLSERLNGGVWSNG
jgi:hypothetical protein